MSRTTILLAALVVLLCVPNFLSAQQFPAYTLPQTEVRSITSNIVNSDDYKIYVALPEGYDTSKITYPTLYILDATSQYAMTVGIYRLLRMFGEVPPMLIVGIEHSRDFIGHRSRDFLPMVMTREQIARKYGDGLAMLLPQSGGARSFHRFFKEELIPFIEKNYRANPADRGIFGHSAGGLFVAYSLFTDPDLFQRYLISSSASWLDDDAVLAYETKLYEKRKQISARVFCTVGAWEGDLIIGGWQRLCDRLKSRDYTGLELKTLKFDRESHVSVPAVAYSSALRVLYRKAEVSSSGL